jgi:hypothetical protein
MNGEWCIMNDIGKLRLFDATPGKPDHFSYGFIEI